MLLLLFADTDPKRRQSSAFFDIMLLIMMVSLTRCQRSPPIVASATKMKMMTAKLVRFSMVLLSAFRVFSLGFLIFIASRAEHHLSQHMTYIHHVLPLDAGYQPAGHRYLRSYVGIPTKLVVRTAAPTLTTESSAP